MKTRWGRCNPRTRTIRLNTELVKKPTDLLEYVVVHEMLHLIEPAHDERFLTLMSRHYPGWREARAELNECVRDDTSDGSDGVTPLDVLRKRDAGQTCCLVTSIDP